MEQIITSLIDVINANAGEDLKVYNVAEITTVTKYIFIVTANSSVHAQSLTKHVTNTIHEHQHDKYLMTKNIQTNNPWVLIDASDILVHIFDSKSREFYNLEKLYLKAESIL